MTYKDQLKDLQSIIDNEGFDYTFVNYSSFKEIENITFHKLRVAYIKAQQRLEHYINKHAKD